MPELWALWDAAVATWRAGGSVMPPLAVGTVLLWYTAGMRAMTLRRGDPRPLRELFLAHRAALQAGRPLPASGVVGVAVARVARLRPRRDDPRARKSLRVRLRAELADLEADMARGARLVKSVVVLAPLLGLLGTVSGMIETFDSLAEMALYSQGGGVAAGVGQALLTTQVGLVVAIPGLLAERLLARKQARLQTDLDELVELACTAPRDLRRAA